jgi:putative component of membrane protein insertase Oxa1/YidC/SpoIIIJ protein YidD
MKNNHYAVLVRPKVSLVKGLFILLAVMVFFLIGIFNIHDRLFMLSFIGLFLMIICLKSKSIIIWSILIYQKYAPAELRLSCCFEPSCSEYMKLAIEKYGVFKGLRRGIKRLSRCHYPNGGEDNP